MTYKVTGIDEDDEKYELTGTWSVENGVVVADVTMDSTESENRVYKFNSAPSNSSTFTQYLTLAADPVKEENSQISNISEIEPFNPSIIMYLLN